MRKGRKREKEKGRKRKAEEQRDEKNDRCKRKGYFPLRIRIGIDGHRERINKRNDFVKQR